MNAEALLRDLRTRGVRLEARGDRLWWEAPPGTITSQVLDVLRANKAELLTALQAGPDVDDLRQFAAAWRGAARELSEIAGYPRLPFKPAYAVLPGAASWGTFIARASVPDLQLVVAALRDLIASMPRPGGEL